MANGFILPEVTTISATVKFPAKTPIPVSNIVCTGSTMEFTFTFPVDALDKFKRDFFVRKSN